MSPHWLSPWRTTGPRGSLEIVSGRMTWSLGFAKVARLEASDDLSFVFASQPPFS